MAGTQDGRYTGWQVHRMTGTQDDRYTGWQVHRLQTLSVKTNTSVQ